MNLIAKLQKFPDYWRLRKLLSRLYYTFMGFMFSSKLHLQEMQENTSILKTLVKNIVWRTIISIALIVILESLEYFLTSRWAFISTVFHSIQLTNLKQSIPYDTLFAGIAGVTGLLLGLYFAALTSLISSRYYAYPGTLLSLLLREKAGNHYIGVLSFTTVYSVILLCYISLGRVPGVINTIFVTFLSCYVIYCFTFLGKRVFSFFDPAQLSYSIFNDINKDIKSSTVKGFAWKDTNYQSYYHDQAKQAIDTYSVLVNFCSTSPQITGSSLLEVLKRGVYLVINYQKKKVQIPSDSNWYEKHFDHQDWFLASSSQLGIALQTSTSLQPKVKSDNYWLELQIIDIILFAVKEYLKRDDVKNVYLVLDTVNVLVQDFGSRFETKQIIKLLKTMENILDEYIQQKSNEGQYDILSNTFWMALVDCYGLFYISPLLGFFNKLGANPKSTFEKLLDSVKWNSSKGAYASDFPYKMLDRLEYVFDRLEFEKSVEGQILSPSWYRNQLIIGRFAELIDETTCDLITMAVEFYIRKTELLYQQKQYIACTLLGHRGLEWCKKAYHHLGICPAMSDTLSEYHIRKELQWPQWKWEELNTQVNNLEKEIYKIMVRCLLFIVESSQDGKLPDLYGQTYHMILLAIYQMLKMHDSEAVKDLVPLFFASVLQAHEVLRKKTDEWADPTASLIFSTEPIADLMELSGYSLVYSELYEIPELWNPIKTCWDAYFDSNSDQAQAAKYLNDLNSFRKSNPSLTPHSLIYSSWKIELNQIIKSNVQIGDDLIPGLRKRHTVLHPSPLIRTISTSRYGFHGKASDLFLLVYVANRPDSAAVSFDDRFGFRKQLEKEKLHSKESDNQEREAEEQDPGLLSD